MRRLIHCRPRGPRARLGAFLRLGRGLRRRRIALCCLRAALLGRGLDSVSILVPRRGAGRLSPQRFGLAVASRLPRARRCQRPGQPRQRAALRRGSLPPLLVADLAERLREPAASALSVSDDPSDRGDANDADELP